METKNRNPNDWMQTYTRRRFWPLDPLAEDVDIEDIAHALSMKCRYTGHCDDFYSVAQHSVLVADIVEAHSITKFDRTPTLDELRWALLHDAAEAYLPDVARPVKPLLQGFDKVERRVLDAIADRFGLPREIPEIVRLADQYCYATEYPRLMHGPHRWEVAEKSPVYFTLDPVGPREAKKLFLDRFLKYFPAEKELLTR